MTNFIDEIQINFTLWTSVLAWAIAGLLKVILNIGKSRKINVALLVSTGGMPSSHSSFVMAMTTAIGFRNGFDSSLFALAAVTSMVVMVDAAGVRRAAGKQAEIINMILESAEDSGIKVDKKLKELLGHTPVEVAAGALLGILVAIVCVNAW